MRSHGGPENKVSRRLQAWSEAEVKMTTKELLKEVSRRVAAGESKKALFEHYRWTENEAAVVRYLPTQVSLKLRQRWRGLNWVLIACLVVVTLFKAFDVGCQLLAGRDLSVRAVFGLVLLGVVVNVAVIVGIARYSGSCYLILICFMGHGLAKIIEPLDKIQWGLDLATAIYVANAAFAVANLVLALVLYHYLLPNTNFFLQAKRDKNGNPIFED